MRGLWIVMVAMGLAVGPLFAAEVTGARIVEAPDVVLHVDLAHPEAADAQGGAEARPYKTITAAVQEAMRLRQGGRSVKVLVRPGIYRETVHLFSPPPGDAKAPALIIEGTDPARVIINGADLLPWQREGEASIYSAPWRYRWGAEPVPQGWEIAAKTLQNNPVVMRREMVLVDGKVLRQVMSADQMRAQAGSYFVEEPAAEQERGRIWTHLPAGVDPASGRVEAGIRPYLFIADNITNLVIRNLTLRQAATQFPNSAVRISGCRNLLMENCRVEWCSWNAVGLFRSEDLTLRNVVANHNGAGGVGCWRMKNLLMEDVECSHNNWRGAWGGFKGWATGQKFFSLHGGRFVRYTAVGNHAVGLWFDSDNADVLVEEANLSNNDTRGLYLEVSQGPLIFRNCRIRDNGGSGVLGTAVAKVTFENCIITGNGEHQIHIPWLADEQFIRPTRNFQTGETIQIRTEHWTLRGNTIAGGGEGFLMDVGQWEHFFSTFISEHNRWRHADRKDAFATYAKRWAKPTTMDLAGWREVSGQEKESTFEMGRP